jgi:hypothetical protein
MARAAFFLHQSWRKRVRTFEVSTPFLFKHDFKHVDRLFEALFVFLPVCVAFFCESLTREKNDLDVALPKPPPDAMRGSRGAAMVF